MNIKRITISLGMIALFVALALAPLPVTARPFTDVDDAYTISLLHMNGADTSTTFTDESGKTWTASGNAQIDTAQLKFGSASGLFDGSGDYISSADSVDWTPSGNFTIDQWVRWNTLPTSGSYQAIFSQAENTSNAWLMFLLNSAGTYQLIFRVISGSTTIIDVSRNITVSTGTWYHIAITRSGNDFRLFLGGTQQGATVTDADAIPNYAASFILGAYNSSNYFNGWRDEFRFSQTARWTANFTPPVAEYEPATPTPTNTATDTPTNTATFTPTNTATDTATSTATNTATDTATSTASNTPTITDTVPGPTSTFTDTATPSSTSTDTATATMTLTPSHTPSPTATGPTATLSVPTWFISPKISYGEFALSTALLGICGSLIIFGVVLFILLVAGNKRKP